MKLKGVILVLSCEKYINTRVKKNFFDKNINEWYNDWKFVILKGDLNMETDYKYDSKNFILTVKSEDSYICLLKKRVLGIKYINEIINIEEGIMCCGDDAVFNKKLLDEYLNSNNKNDYEGLNTSIPYNYEATNRNLLKNTINDLFMYNYHKLYPSEIKGFTLDYLLQICNRPNVYGAAGICFYLSNKSCFVLVEHMEKIVYNIFHYDEFTKSYPYTIEDAAISFILYYHNIGFVNNKYFHTHNKNLDNYICSYSPETWYTNVPNLKWRL